MRVVMVLGRSTGGIGTHVVELVSGLRAEEDRVTVVTDAVTADRFGIADAKRWWPGRAVGLVGSVRRVWWLRGLARHADVVHAHGHQAGLVATVAMLGLPTPLVVSQHNAVLVGGVRRRLLDLVQRFVARRAALVTGASSDLVEVARRQGAREARLAEVPSPRVPGLLAAEPLDDDERRQLAAELLQEKGIQPPPDARLVLTIARVAPQKDLATLVDAAAQLPPQVTHPNGTKPADHTQTPPQVTHPNGTKPADDTQTPLQVTHPIGTKPAGEAQISFHLGESPADDAQISFHLGELPAGVWVVVGGGDVTLRAELERRAAAAGAPVRFVGPQHDPGPWLRAADVFVLTSRWEARALVVQEAMAAGVPVVATATGGLPDLLEGVGTLVPVGDAGAVADAVGRYLREPGTRHTASVAGRERAASWDDGAATARRWRQWYSALLAMT